MRTDTFEHDGTPQGMAQAIAAFVREQRGSVSFVELSRRIPGFCGEYTLERGLNMVLWSGVSAVAADACKQLSALGVQFAPTTVLVYFIDGGALTLPLVKRIPRGGAFKHPHWLPVVLNLAQPPGVKQAPAKRTKK